VDWDIKNGLMIRAPLPS